MESRELRALLAKNIRLAARKKRVSLTALADFAVVSRSQVFNVLESSTAATVDWIEKIAKALDVELCDVVEDHRDLIEKYWNEHFA